MVEEVRALILVVDDNADNRDVLAARLLEADYRVLKAESGPRALEMVEQNNPDLLLLDLMMPEMSGIEVLRTLRMKHSANALPIIMVSANHESSHVVEALQCGANDYVTKPVDFPIALARVESQLARRHELRGVPAATLPLLEPGTAIGPYRIEEEVGHGAMGRVFRALDLRLDRPVAIKALREDHAVPQARLDRFLQEARAIARIRHPGVTAIYDVALEPRAYIVMELVEGVSLDSYLQRKPLPLADALRLGREIAEAVAAVHRHGILHRDLKPSNVMVDPSTHIRLLDFGLARLREADVGVTVQGEILGTPRYMAPERFDPTLGETDEQSDVFGVGALLYEMLTGRPPVKAHALQAVIAELLMSTPQPPSALNPEVPPHIDHVCLRALARMKADRYASAADLAADLMG